MTEAISLEFLENKFVELEELGDRLLETSRLAYDASLHMHFIATFNKFIMLVKSSQLEKEIKEVYNTRAITLLEEYNEDKKLFITSKQIVDIEKRVWYYI